MLDSELYLENPASENIYVSKIVKYYLKLESLESERCGVMLMIREFKRLGEYDIVSKYTDELIYIDERIKFYEYEIGFMVKKYLSIRKDNYTC